MGSAPCYSWKHQDFQKKNPTSQSEYKYLSFSPVGLFSEISSLETIISIPF